MVSTEEFDSNNQDEEILLDFFKQSPFPDLDLDLPREKDLDRDIDL